MRYAAIAGLVVSLSLLGALPPRAADPPKEDPLADRVRLAIERGVKYLRDQEEGRGHIEKDLAGPRFYPGGMTALATMAMLTSGVPADDPAVQRFLKYLRTLNPNQGGNTYVVGLQAMVYAAAGQNEDRERIQQCVDWLVAAPTSGLIRKGKALAGWSYNKGGPVADNSNTQYALLGLHEGFLAGAKIDPEVWEEIRDFYERTQVKGGGGRGGWSYRNDREGGGGATLTMSTAGLCGLLIADMDLKASRDKGEPNCGAADCGGEQDSEAIKLALEYVGRTLPRRASEIGTLQHVYYSLYGIERAGRFSGQRFLGENDWYRLGCEYLVDKQRPDGSWGGADVEFAPVISTSFAILFLSKGRTPVLMSKLVHGPVPDSGNDWNLHRSDARNLVAFASTELFKKQPLAWQVFDTRRAGGDLTKQRIEELTAELLQSPLAYFSGTKAPRFTDGEEAMLREYVQNGGFLYAEAACGQPGFDTGFRALVKRLFPDPGTQLKLLPPDHPVYTASGKFAVSPKDYPLWGVEMGCKTVVIYSPKGLSCYWEHNQHDKGNGREAFRLGANLIAYATGMEPPRPRLTKVDVVKTDDEKKVPRGFLKVAQVRHEGKRQAGQAVANLMTEMRKTGLDVALQTEDIALTHENLVDFRLLYMHGRNAFSPADAELDKLRFHLETGGLLFADACCGSKEFDKSFRAMVKQLWPDKPDAPGKPLEPIPATDELFSKELNGTLIQSVRCRREGPDGKGAETELHTVAPQLEGVRVNGRWAVIYSRYDIGCALEKHQSPECRGHDFASAVLLGKAAVLYALRR